MEKNIYEIDKNVVIDVEAESVKIFFGDEEDIFGVDMNSERGKKAQEEANKAFQQVYVTDFNNVDEVIDLFYNLQQHGDSIYVQLPYDHLIHILHQHGYRKRSFSEKMFKNFAKDKEATGRYLIGRFICYMEGEYLGIRGLPNAIYYDAKAYKEHFSA